MGALAAVVVGVVEHGAEVVDRRGGAGRHVVDEVDLALAPPDRLVALLLGGRGGAP